MYKVKTVVHAINIDICHAPNGSHGDHTKAGLQASSFQCWYIGGSFLVQFHSLKNIFIIDQVSSGHQGSALFGHIMARRQ